MTNALQVVTALVALAISSNALAAERTFSFDVELTLGPRAGQHLLGSVAFDDSGIPLGSPGLGETGLVSTLAFSYAGVDFSAATANTGYLELNLDGTLAALSFGNNCGPGGCAALNPGDWFVVLGDADPVESRFGGSLGGEVEQGIVRYVASPIPEPGTHALALLGVFAFMAGRRVAGRFSTRPAAPSA